MRRVVFNQKGGVGKTTIVCNLAAMAAEHGKKTLVIDLDAQCNATQYLLSSGDKQADVGSVDFFETTLKRGRHASGLAEFITPTPFHNLSIVAAHPDLEEIRVKLEAKHKIYKLRQALDKLTEYDVIYIDTPPAMNFFSQSALIAASNCLIPFDCDDFARQALYNLFDTIDEVQEDHNPALAVDGVVVNQFQSQANLPRRIIDELTSEGYPMLDTHLASSVKVRESHEASIPLVYRYPNHKVGQQYAELYNILK